MSILFSVPLCSSNKRSINNKLNYSKDAFPNRRRLLVHKMCAIYLCCCILDRMLCIQPTCMGIPVNGSSSKH